jgi:two-component system CheB/CheR fusion protein
MYARDRHAKVICVLPAPAGDLAPLRDFLGESGACTTIAFLVLDRRSPDRDPLALADLAAMTALPVVEAADGRPLLGGEVVLVGPETHLDFKGGKFLLHALPAAVSSKRGAVLTQDVDALARTFRSRAAAVLLDPADIEAVLALEALPPLDGAAFLLTGASAGPRDEIAAARRFADLEADAPTIVAELTAMAQRLSEAPQPLSELTPDEVREICDLIREATGHDFRHYKVSTLSRRIQRRMGVLHGASFADYRDHLRSKPEEVQTLMRDLLIGVTSFFRDPEAFEALATNVLDSLIRADATDPVRIWIPGCATGQEAYSVAILAMECVERSGSTQQIQIFATDLNERSLSVARRGTYPAAIADEVTPERLDRWFHRSGRQWQVSRVVRQAVAFSPHNLIADPPLSRMDLICCRNLLIYLGEHLQKKLMSVFHYALKPNGFLFLGSSETVTGHADLFHAVDARHRITQRREISARARSTPRGPAAPFSGGWQPVMAAGPVDLGAVAQRIVLDEFAPPYVIANDSAQIVYLSPRADAFLQAPAGQYINSVLRMARPDLRPGLRSAWTRAHRTRRTAVHDVHVTTDGRREVLRLTVQPMPELGRGEGSAMVVFQSLPHFEAATPDPAPAGRSDSEPLIEQLESELHRTREELDRVVQDFEAANEELKSSNEELLSMNEELYAANEELEASKDEIQQSAEAVERVNADLVNLLASTEIATIFLDGDGLIRGFTPIAKRLYNLTDADVGRPLDHFTHHFTDLPPLPDMAEVGPDSPTKRAEVHHRDGRVFLRRVTPYRIGDRVDGLVITFIDITDQHQTSARLAASLADIETIYRHAPIGMCQISADFTFLRINDTLAAINGQPADAHVGRRVDDVVPALADQARAIMAEVVRTGAAVGPVQITGTTPGNPHEPRIWLQTWAPIHAPDGAVASVLVSVVDVTEHERQAAQARDSAFRLRKTMDQVLAFVGVLSPDGILLEANEPAIAAAGVDRADLIGKPFPDCSWWQTTEATRDRLRQAIAAAARGAVVRYDVEIATAAGPIIIDFQLSPYRDHAGQIVYLIPSGVDITERVRARASLQEALHSLEIALDAGSLGIFDWNIQTGAVHWNDNHFRIFGHRPGAFEPDYNLWQRGVHPDDLDRVTRHIEVARERGERYQATYRVVHPGGRAVQVEGTGIFYYDEDGNAVRMVGVVKDITALKAGEERLREIMGTSQVGIVLSRADGTIVEANAAARALLGVDDSATPDGWAWRDHVEPAALPAARRFTVRLLRRGRVGPVELPIVAADGERRICLISATRIEGTQDESVTFIMDLSAQKKAEAHRELLVGELNHRVKNTLATIQAMASHTLRTAPDPQTFERAFKGRLHAIAIAHEIVMGGDSGTVGLTELIRRQVGPYTDLEREQIRLNGTDIRLSPEVAHALGLVLHELTTNAAKYGALSVDGGRIDIEWSIRTVEGVDSLCLQWQESGGPPVVKPERAGFGSRLIASSLSHALNGSADLDFRETGLVVNLTLAREAIHA